MKILALFNDQKQAGNAISALNKQKALRNEIAVEVVETATEPDPESVGQMPGIAPVAPNPSGGTIPAMGVLAQAEKPFKGFEISQAQRAFLKRSVRDGGQLVHIQVEARYQPQVETILRQNAAQMIHVAG